jgi:GT2 family glycosyltransferase
VITASEEDQVADRRIAVLMTCFNRRETTLRALRSLTRQRGFAFSVVLLDDGSTDGTGDAVRVEFPYVKVLDGDGTAFWNGGMNIVWNAALELPVEGFLWLNDDVQLDPDAMMRLAAAWDELADTDDRLEAILVGPTRSVEGHLTYGGKMFRRTPSALRFQTLPETDQLTRVDTFNGNVVLVPRTVVNKVGLNDAAYFQQFGDIDYGLRARRKGVPSYVLPATVGICEANKLVRIARHELPLRERFKHANGPRGLPFASWWRFTRRFSGIWFPIHFISPYRKLFLPPWRKSM